MKRLMERLFHSYFHVLTITVILQAFKLLKSGEGCKIMVDPHT